MPKKLKSFDEVEERQGICKNKIAELQLKLESRTPLRERIESSTSGAIALVVSDVINKFRDKREIKTLQRKVKKLEKLASNMEQPATVTEIAEEEMDQDNYFLYPVSIEDGLDQDNSFLDSVSHVKHVQPAQCTQR